MHLNRAEIDCLLLCTQSPDYFLPTTAAVLQDRLQLPTRCAALDFNLGCSGYVYGLYLSKALIASGLARNVLLITAETYSKYVHPRDRTCRVIFGDGATATLVSNEPLGSRIRGIVLGTDGSGYADLIVPAGAARRPAQTASLDTVTDESGCQRTEMNLFMNGAEVLRFTLKRVPEVVTALLTAEGLGRDEIDWFILHQANQFMNDHLCHRLGIPREKAPMCLDQYGNTVSSTIPITMHRWGRQFRPGDRTMLVGFGVGYSWGACLLDWGAVELV
jgi:3-oxoacyl-[acyl-carrier-protein] synthase-3